MTEPQPLENESARKIAFGACVVIAVTYGVVFLPAKWVDLLAGREMIFETLGSVFFLAASVYFFLAFRAVGPKAAESPHAWWRRTAYALLALLLFVACGEELSWGQHLLGYETPETVKELNAQQEMNLHNLWLVDSFDPEGEKKSGWRSLLNSNRLFDYFMVTLLWILPWAHALQPTLAGWIDRLGGPVVPRFLGLPLAVSFVLTAATELLVVDGMVLHLAVSETRELSYALLCALAARFLLLRERGEGDVSG